MEERFSINDVGHGESDPFALLESSGRLAQNDTEELGRRLRSPGYLEKLCKEIHDLLQIVSRPESSERVGGTEFFEGSKGLSMIYFMEQFFMGTQNVNSSLHKLYRKYVTTPDNLEALCQIAEVQTETTRCRAASLLVLLCEERIVWKIKMRNGTRFAMLLFRTLGKILDPSASDHAAEGTFCTCFKISWGALNKALSCYTSNDSDMVAALSTCDWKANFDGCHGAEEQQYEASNLKLRSYGKMLGISYRVLHIDQSNVSALKIVGDLGSCHDLCRRMLAKFPKIMLQPTAEERFACFNSLIFFLFYYFHSFRPIPVDRQFQKLVRAARSVILKMKDDMVAFEQSNARNAEAVDKKLTSLSDSIEWIIGFTEIESLKRLNKIPPEMRRQLFMTETIGNALRDRTEAEKLEAKKQKKKDAFFVKSTASIDVCANCRVDESTLNSKLLTCSSCKRIKYCSKKCQVDHWKLHKHQCKQFSAK